MKLRHLLTGILCGALLGACGTLPESADEVMSGDAPPTLLSWSDVRKLPSPDELPQLFYGTDQRQFGELRLPPGVPGPFPVMILIPGDCWRADDNYAYLRPLAESLSTLGIATWTIEYRRIGDSGGWPATFRDVAMAADHLRVLAQNYPLDLRRVVAAGHSGGGQLALWLAARPRLAENSPLYVRGPMTIHGVIGLAAITDLAAQRSVTRRACGSAVDELLGGNPQTVAERYALTSPLALLPLRVPQWFVHGAHDRLASTDSVMRYVEAARKHGDRVVVGVTSNAGHYEPVVPGSATWMTLQQAVVAALLQ